MNNYPYWNPYAFNQTMQNQMQGNAMNILKTTVKSVTGIDGARMYPMAPDSSELLLDQSSAIVYLVTTDSAGYKTVNAYSITPVVEQPKIDVSDIDERLKRLEEQISAKSDNGGTRTKKSE